MPNFDVEVVDEFDDFTPVKSSSIPTSSKPTTASVIAGQDIDWGAPADIGTGDGLDRIRAQKDEVVRFALVPGFPARAKQTHYIEQPGKSGRSYLCTGDQDTCPGCRQNYAKAKIAALAVRYKNAERTTGKLDKDTVPVYEVGFLLLSRDNYKQMIGAVPEGSSPLDVDYRMSYDGQRYTFQVVATKARHLVRGETAAIIELAKPLANRLDGKLGVPFPAGGFAPPQTSTPRVVQGAWEN